MTRTVGPLAIMLERNTESFKPRMPNPRTAKTSICRTAFASPRISEGMDGAFTVLDFEDVEDPNVLYVEYPTGAVHVEKPGEVADAHDLIDRLCAVALPPPESVAFVERFLTLRYAD